MWFLSTLGGSVVPRWRISLVVRRCGLSASSLCLVISSLVVRRTCLSSIGERAFPVAFARLWNTLPQCSFLYQSRVVGLTIFSACSMWLWCVFLKNWWLRWAPTRNFLFYSFLFVSVNITNLITFRCFSYFVQYIWLLIMFWERLNMRE